MIFSMLNSEKIWRENITDLSTSPVRCSHFTLRNAKKVIFGSIILTYFWLFRGYFRRKQTVIHLPTPLENVTTLTCELQSFFIRVKVCCVLSNVGGSEESQLWVVVGGSEKNRLWWVATGMSSKQCHSKYSEWPPSALIHASSHFWRGTSTSVLGHFGPQSLRSFFWGPNWPRTEVTEDRSG